MKILCVFGEHAYGDPARGEAYEAVNFLPALRRLGHQVSFFESFSRAPYADFAELNRALLQRVEETSPDLVLCVLMQYEVWIETMRLIRKSGPLLVNWSTDDSWKYEMFSRLIGCEFDLYATTYSNRVAQYQRDGIGSVYLSQWAANAEALAPPIPARDCRYPVSFIGALYGHRRDMVDRLRREGIDVVCFGHGWPAGPIEAKRIPEIVRDSQISLNFSLASRQGLGSSMGRQIKARVFEVPGYGGLLLTEQVPQLDKYFQVGEEILTFEGCEELVRTIKSLLANPERRDAVARRGFERVRNEHTYDRRFADLLGELARRVAQRSRRSIEWPEFEAAACRHTFGPALKMFRAFLVVCTMLFWGRRRAPRAARRIAFELSWRFLGSHTYTAAGWPGRMFYRES
ncbi:MAG TPA: glycosyltransferase [Nitrospiraceae bacterium]|nr:glycosyltransferase [Nitrospiraceae bacterium]